MDYMSTLEGLKGLSNALGGCSKHRVETWAILYPLVKVTESLKLLILVSKVPCSHSFNFEECHID